MTSLKKLAATAGLALTIGLSAGGAANAGPAINLSISTGTLASNPALQPAYFGGHYGHYGHYRLCYMPFWRLAQMFGYHAAARIKYRCRFQFGGGYNPYGGYGYGNDYGYGN